MVRRRRAGPGGDGAPPCFRDALTTATLSDPTFRKAFDSESRRPWPSDALDVGECLSEGGNNCIHVLERRGGGERYALRSPLGESDTRKRAYAEQELRVTVRLAELGVAPRVFAARYVPRTQVVEGGGRRARGLHLVMELFDMDARTCVLDDPAGAVALGPWLSGRIVEHLRALAGANVFVYDVKLQNVVLREPASAQRQLRLVDFGSDFCECADLAAARRPAPAADAPEARDPDTPVQRAIASVATDAAAYQRIMFLVMLIVFSANIVHEVEGEKRSLCMTPAERAQLAFLRAATHEERRRCTPSEVVAVKAVLRHRDVRDHLAYYNGRRNRGVWRTFKAAGFLMDLTRSFARISPEGGGPHDTIAE
jgi:hypothetical protein